MQEYPLGDIDTVPNAVFDAEFLKAYSAFLFIMVRMRTGGINRYEKEVLDTCLEQMKKKGYVSRKLLLESISKTQEGSSYDGIENPDDMADIESEKQILLDIYKKAILQSPADYFTHMSNFSVAQGTRIKLTIQFNALNGDKLKAMNLLIQDLLKKGVLETLPLGVAKPYENNAITVVRTRTEPFAHLNLDFTKEFLGDPLLYLDIGYTQNDEDRAPIALLRALHFFKRHYLGNADVENLKPPVLEDTLEDPEGVLNQLIAGSDVFPIETKGMRHWSAIPKQEVDDLGQPMDNEVETTSVKPTIKDRLLTAEDRYHKSVDRLIQTIQTTQDHIQKKADLIVDSKSKKDGFLNYLSTIFNRLRLTFFKIIGVKKADGQSVSPLNEPTHEIITDLAVKDQTIVDTNTETEPKPKADEYAAVKIDDDDKLIIEYLEKNLMIFKDSNHALCIRLPKDKDN